MLARFWGKDMTACTVETSDGQQDDVQFDVLLPRRGLTKLLDGQARGSWGVDFFC